MTRSRLWASFHDRRAQIAARLTSMYMVLLAANALAWAWAVAAFHTEPVLFGAAALAYSFGLRHAVDADHIAAIDNVTRRLMRQGKRPVSVGLFFSLGHSTVVVLATVAVAATSGAFKERFAALQDVGAVVGTGISAFFLLLIALLNVFTLVSVYRTFRSVQAGGTYAEADFDLLLARRGLMGRLLYPVMRIISKTWHMYPLGFLFGLGFDTATEIGLLGIAAAEASHGVSLWSILVFPALFTAGMSLVDTTDGVVMVGAYGWAFVKPIRKLFYNLTVTLISIFVALVIGMLEVLNLMAGQLNLAGGFWRWVGNLNDHFGTIGGAIVAIFIVCWGISALLYQRRAGDEAEVNPG